MSRKSRLHSGCSRCSLWACMDHYRADRALTMLLLFGLKKHILKFASFVLVPEMSLALQYVHFHLILCQYFRIGPQYGHDFLCVCVEGFAMKSSANRSAPSPRQGTLRIRSVETLQRLSLCACLLYCVWVWFTCRLLNAFFININTNSIYFIYVHICIWYVYILYSCYAFHFSKQEPPGRFGAWALHRLG